MNKTKPDKAGIYLGAKKNSKNWNYIVKVTGDTPYFKMEILEIDDFFKWSDDSKKVFYYSSEITSEPNKELAKHFSEIKRKKASRLKDEKRINELEMPGGRKKKLDD